MNERPDVMNVLFILQEFPDAEICVLTFTDFLDPWSEPDGMKEGLRARVADWASSIGVPSGAKTLNGLVDELQASGRTIFFLIDEVQRFFEVQKKPCPSGML